ncbi:hypothetical protein ADL26_15140, partial [Thermoactinomyces vulgaris]
RHHAGRGAGDRAVVVEDRERQRLQEHALGERPGDGDDGGAGEVQLAFGVHVDVALEAVVGEPLGGGLLDDAPRSEVLEVGVLEAEALDGLGEAADAGDDAVAAAGGQAAPEDLEDATMLRGAVAEGRFE